MKIELFRIYNYCKTDSTFIISIRIISTLVFEYNANIRFDRSKKCSKFKMVIND